MAIFVSKKKYDAVVAELEWSIRDKRGVIETNKDLVAQLQKKESEIFRLNEKIRNLQKKPFKK